MRKARNNQRRTRLLQIKKADSVTFRYAADGGSTEAKVWVKLVRR